jgi:hypothetical protein
MQTLILENNKISQVVTVVLVDAQTPFFSVNKYLLVLAQYPSFDNVINPFVFICE